MCIVHKISIVFLTINVYMQFQDFNNILYNSNLYPSEMARRFKPN